MIIPILEFKRQYREGQGAHRPECRRRSFQNWNSNGIDEFPDSALQACGRRLFRFWNSNSNRNRISDVSRTVENDYSDSGIQTHFRLAAERSYPSVEADHSASGIQTKARWSSDSSIGKCRR